MMGPARGRLQEKSEQEWPCRRPLLFISVMAEIGTVNEDSGQERRPCGKKALQIDNRAVRSLARVKGDRRLAGTRPPLRVPVVAGLTPSVARATAPPPSAGTAPSARTASLRHLSDSYFALQWRYWHLGLRSSCQKQRACAQNNSGSASGQGVHRTQPTTSIPFNRI